MAKSKKTPKTDGRRRKRAKVPRTGLPPVVPYDPLDPNAPLSDDESAFVSCYLRHFHKGRAYREVHPHVTRATARVQGHYLLRKPNVRAEVEAELREMRKAARLESQKVLNEQCMIAFANVSDVENPDGSLRRLRDIPFNTCRAIQSYHLHERRNKQGRIIENKVTVKLNSKAEALAKLFNYLGLTQEISPIESLLAALPREMAASIRAALVAPQKPSANGQKNGAPNGSH